MAWNQTSVSRSGSDGARLAEILNPDITLHAGIIQIADLDTLNIFSLLSSNIFIQNTLYEQGKYTSSFDLTALCLALLACQEEKKEEGY